MKKCVDHLGIEYNSMEAMCRKYGIETFNFSNRLSLGWDLESALTVPTSKLEKVKDHLGNEFKSVVSMCKVYGVSPSTYKGRIARGWTKEKALTIPTVHKVVDHKGNEYRTLEEMCEAYDVTLNVFRAKRKKGLSLEECLATPKDFIPVTDPFGNFFANKKSMLDFYNLTAREYNKRIRKGWKPKEALIVPSQDSACFNGNNPYDFNSLTELSDRIGIPASRIRVFIADGAEIDELLSNNEKFLEKCKNAKFEKAIFYGAYLGDKVVYVGRTIRTLEERVKNHFKEARNSKDYNKFHIFLLANEKKIEFKVIKTIENATMSEIDNIEVNLIAHYDTFRNGYNSTIGGCGVFRSPFYTDIDLQNKVLELYEQGNSVKKIFKITGVGERIVKNFLISKGYEVKDAKCKPCTDHLGNSFDSAKAMYTFYGLKKCTYQNRINEGWSLEKTLTVSTKIAYSVKDHLGNEFESRKQMCAYYGINPFTFNDRIENGWPLEKALTTKARKAELNVDFLGNIYSSVAKMCEAFGLTESTFRKRINMGYSLKDALTMPIKTQYSRKVAIC